MKQSRIARPIAAVASPAVRSLPLVALLVDTQAELFELMVRSGLRVLDAMREEDRTALCGPRAGRAQGGGLAAAAFFVEAEPVRFRFIAAEKATHAVTILCRCLCVTRSGGSTPGDSDRSRATRSAIGACECWSAHRTKPVAAAMGARASTKTSSSSTFL